MATEVFSCFHDASKKVSSGSKLAMLFVPDGHWFIVGKVVVRNDNTSTYQSLTARLIAGADVDTSYVRLGPSGVHSADIMSRPSRSCTRSQATATRPKTRSI